MEDKFFLLIVHPQPWRDFNGTNQTASTRVWHATNVAALRSTLLIRSAATSSGLRFNATFFNLRIPRMGRDTGTNCLSFPSGFMDLLLEANLRRTPGDALFVHNLQFCSILDVVRLMG